MADATAGVCRTLTDFLSKENVSHELIVSTPGIVRVTIHAGKVSTDDLKTVLATAGVEAVVIAGTILNGAQTEALLDVKFEESDQQPPQLPVKSDTKRNYTHDLFIAFLISVILVLIGYIWFGSTFIFRL